jgi:hypothetical protein
MIKAYIVKYRLKAKRAFAQRLFISQHAEALTRHEHSLLRFVYIKLPSF